MVKSMIDHCQSGTMNNGLKMSYVAFYYYSSKVLCIDKHEVDLTNRRLIVEGDG